jgi:small-conductance mechanosensitive channel
MNQEFLNSMISDLLVDLHEPGVVRQVLWQIGVLVAVCALSWIVIRAIARRFDQVSPPPAAVSWSTAHLSSALGPLAAWLLLRGITHIAGTFHQHANLLRIAAVLLLAAGVLRLVSYAIGRVFKPSGLVALIQRLFTALVFGAVVLHVSGFLPDVLEALEIPIYKASDMPKPLTLLELFRDGSLILVALVAALWAGTVLDSRLMKIDSIDASLRVALARFTRAALLVLAVLIAMNGVGIPLGVLSVFGGALGVWLGL